MGKARSVYLKDDKLWDKLQKIAVGEQRSINFIIERAIRTEVVQPCNAKHFKEQ